MSKRRVGMSIQSVRSCAMALPDVTEAPHFTYASFRVRGKIFITVPPEATHIHVFLDEEDRAPALAMYPGYIEKLWWGKKVQGLRIAMAKAQSHVVESLIRAAWAGKAPKSLLRESHDEGDQRA